MVFAAGKRLEGRRSCELTGGVAGRWEVLLAPGEPAWGCRSHLGPVSSWVMSAFFAGLEVSKEKARRVQRGHNVQLLLGSFFLNLCTELESKSWKLLRAPGGVGLGLQAQLWVPALTSHGQILSQASPTPQISARPPPPHPALSVHPWLQFAFSTVEHPQQPQCGAPPASSHLIKRCLSFAGDVSGLVPRLCTHMLILSRLLQQRVPAPQGSSGAG